MPCLHLTVNGVDRDLDVPASRYLAEVLRYDLKLTGTKIGCNEAECGACTVIVNGQPVDSCIYPAFKAQGARVTTIEGLAEEWSNGRGARGDAIRNSQLATHNLQLHPLQDAFVLHGATQCGFCTPGILMTVEGGRRAGMTSDEIVHDSLPAHLCRCTGYDNIRLAIEAYFEAGADS